MANYPYFAPDPYGHQERGTRSLRETRIPTDIPCFRLPAIEALGTELIRLGSIFRLSPQKAPEAGLSDGAVAAISAISYSPQDIQITIRKF
jgi:hypothetical protein